MPNLADTFPATGTIPSFGFPVHVGTTQPANPTIGTAWYNPNTSQLQVLTGAGWKVASAQPGSGRLIDLSDVDAISALEGDILVYDSFAGQWVAEALNLDYGRY